MAVVIKPSENRLAMAKPPPKKLESHEAGLISDARKRGRTGACFRDIYVRVRLPAHYLTMGADAFTSIFNVKKLADHWLEKALGPKKSS
jgi:hypothetical protein